MRVHERTGAPPALADRAEDRRRGSSPSRVVKLMEKIEIERERAGAAAGRMVW